MEGQGVTDIHAAREDSLAAIDFLAACCGQDQYVVTTVVLGEPEQLSVVLLGVDGVYLQQGHR
eukprot:UN20308